MAGGQRGWRTAVVDGGGCVETVEILGGKGGADGPVYTSVQMGAHCQRVNPTLAAPPSYRDKIFAPPKPAGRKHRISVGEVPNRRQTN